MYLYRYSNIRFYWYTHPHHCISALIHDLLLSYNKNTVPRISHLLLIVGKAFWKTQTWHQMLSCFWHLQPSSQSISTFSLRSALHACSLCWALKTQVSGVGVQRWNCAGLLLSFGMVAVLYQGAWVNEDLRRSPYPLRNGLFANRF